MTPTPALRIAYLSVYLIAAWCIFFFYFLNWYLSSGRSRSPSVPLIGLYFMMMTAAGLLLALRATGPIWLLPPLLIIGVTAAQEAQRIAQRRREAAEPPVARDGPSLALHRPVTTTLAAVVWYEFSPPGYDGPDLRIAHISDLHLDDRLPEAYYCEALARAREADPDLVFFTGDFISRDHDVERIPDFLSQVRGRYGTYGILGNHDYWVDSLAVEDAVRAAGVILLDDTCERLELPGGATLFLCGCQSPWSGPNMALPRPQPGELGLILSHTADHMDTLSGSGFAAVFSGHYHAGQLRVPGFGSLVTPSLHGRRFDHGHFFVNGTHLFVTAGLGAETPPIRIYCQPDIFIVDLKGTGSDEHPGDGRLG
jgi:predicted MPP superfamily phosphohydrolase